MSRSVASPSSAVAMRAPGVDGGGVLSPALSDQLVQAVAEVLDLAGAQDAAHSHQVAPPPDAVDMATTAMGPAWGFFLLG